MNDKKRKIEKEITKYDVDRDTQAKSMKVQHLNTMAQYLPLFTKKIKDPKAMKKQKATKELDYTKNQEQLEDLQRRQIMLKQEQARIAAEITFGSKKQSKPSEDKVIRDPAPRIVPKIKLEEMQQQQQPTTGFKKFTQVKKGMSLIEEQEQSNDFQSVNENTGRIGAIELPEHSLDQFMDRIENGKENGFRSHSPVFASHPTEQKTPAQQKSPTRYTQQEMLAQVNIVDRDNYQLKVQIEEKKRELDQLNFKHAKAQSKFIEIMRELSRFRDEFNDQYSIRSKMLKVKDVTDSIESLLEIKELVLVNEEQTLAKFILAENQLFDQKSSDPMKKTLLNMQKAIQSTVVRESAYLQVTNLLRIGQQMKSMISIGKDTNSKLLRISNILCFVTVILNKVKAECTVTVLPKTYNGKLIHVFTQITERFEPWREVAKMNIIGKEDGSLMIECAESQNDKKIADFTMREESNSSIYKGIDNQIIKYIHGAPIRLFTIGISFVGGGNKRAIQFQVLDPAFTKQFCTVEVPEDRIFKDIVPHTLQNREYDIELRSLIYKKDTVMSLLSKFIKKYLQVVIIGVDITEQAILGTTAKANNTLEINMFQKQKYGNFGIVDREAKSLKFRHTKFPGLRVPALALSNLAINNPSMSQNPIKSSNILGKQKTKNSNGSSSNKNLLHLSNEKMKTAVQDHLSKKKDFSVIQNPSTNIVQTNSTLPSDRQLSSRHVTRGIGSLENKRHSTSPTTKASQDYQNQPQNSKMLQIMKLINANSMFMHIHSELFFHDLDDLPAYLELVHNTDDDNLLLFVVDDPRDCFVQEVNLDNLGNDELWQIIRARFGKNSEQIVSNVETLFRSNEFLKIVKGLIAKSRENRNYAQAIGQLTGEMINSSSGLLNFRQLASY